MTSAHYRLRPLDVAMFRDARPFSAEESSVARNAALLPPQLGVLGAFRNLLLEHKGISYEDFGAGKGSPSVGYGPDAPGALSLGPVLWGRESGGSSAAVFPAPADLVNIKGGSYSEVGFQAPRVADRVTNLPRGLSILMPARQDQDAGGLKWVEGNDGVTLEYEVDGRALPSAALENYLLAKEPYLEALSSYFEIDRRVGIERSQQSFTAEEGRLYTAEFIRPSNSSFFVVEVREDSDELPTGPAVVAIGGERRPFEVRADAGVKPIAHATRAAVERELLQRAQTTGRFEFRLYVLSPTPPGPDAKNGWIPHLPTIEGVHLRVMAAAVPRCIWLSGWRVARREPRAARPHIAAGAVYFVRAEFDGLAIEEVVRLVMEKFWYQATLCAEDDKIEERAGHGVTLVGVIPDVH